jgi:mono/diheme cytochrome c family protein
LNEIPNFSNSALVNFARRVAVALPVVVAALVWTAGGVAAAETAPETAGSGSALFAEHCSSCHGAAGEGFRSLYPPLSRSRVLADEPEVLPCIIRHGLRGEIVVDGRVFNQIMPGNPRLSAGDIARIISHMQALWGDENRVIEVETWLEDCK